MVPRTFLGPIFIALTTVPFLNFSSHDSHRLHLQYIGNIEPQRNEIVRSFRVVRGVLGVLVISGLTHLYKALKGYCDTATRRWWLILILTQFHFLFYATRPLPNIFALVIGSFVICKETPPSFIDAHLVLHAFAFWLSGRNLLLVWTSAFAILVFRSELVILLGSILLQEVFLKRRLSFARALGHGLTASALAVGKTPSTELSEDEVLSFSAQCSGR